VVVVREDARRSPLPVLAVGAHAAHLLPSQLLERSPHLPCLRHAPILTAPDGQNADNATVTEPISIRRARRRGLGAALLRAAEAAAREKDLDGR
jgi:hypothetical protein